MDNLIADIRLDASVILKAKSEVRCENAIPGGMFFKYMGMQNMSL